ncbi:MAG: phosphatidylglycerophosphatase A [bacterium]
MIVKESSEELNAPVGTAAAPRTRSTRSAKDYLALAIATCGVGYLPLAPGTWGSLVGVGIYFLLQSLTDRLIRWPVRTNSVLVISPWAIFIAVELATIAVVTLIGIWAATRTEKLSGRKDPGKVVVDEVTGQLIALLPLAPRPGLSSVVLAFALFRFFDIVKPYPARRFEKLESGLGIMSDDIVAGLYAAVGTSVIGAIFFFSTN